MSDDIVTRLEHDLFQAVRDAKSEQKRLLLERALDVVRVAEQRRKRAESMADEIERLRAEVSKWATTPPNMMVCVTHGEMFMCFDEYMGGVYWCDGCRNER